MKRSCCQMCGGRGSVTSLRSCCFSFAEWLAISLLLLSVGTVAIRLAGYSAVVLTLEKTVEVNNEL